MDGVFIPNSALQVFFLYFTIHDDMNMTFARNCIFAIVAFFVFLSFRNQLSNIFAKELLISTLKTFKQYLNQ